MSRRIFTLMMLACFVLALSAGIAHSSNRIYKITFKTGTKSGAGTDSNISLKLYGTAGTLDFFVVNGNISGNAFENGNTDVGSYSVSDCGVIWKMELKSDGAYSGSGWYLETVKVSSTEPSTISDTTFAFNRWIDGDDGVIPRFSDGYKAPAVTQTKSGQLYYSKAYVLDNLAGNSTKSLGLTHTTQLSSTKSLSSSTTSSQTTELSVNWESPDTVCGKFGADFKATWDSAITTESSASEGINIETSYNFTDVLRAEAKSYTIVIIQEQYDLNFAMMDDSFSDAYWLRYMKSSPQVSNPKTFSFGPDQDQVKWNEWNDASWHTAISTALGPNYNTIMASLQGKGYLEKP